MKAFFSVLQVSLVNVQHVQYSKTDSIFRAHTVVKEGDKQSIGVT